MMSRKAVSVAFNGSHQRYDYWCDQPVKVGDNAIVWTRRGEATVVVVEVKEHSDKATAAVQRIVTPDINTLF